MTKHALTQSFQPTNQAKDDGSNSTNEDCVRNYSINALALSMIAKDFEDARKHGDGQRIVRLLKFMMLFFKHDRKHKYAFHILHYLIQIKCVLPPKLAHDLIWIRFVNNCGKIDSNVEMDREMEHYNRAFKLDSKSFMGKVSEQSINRTSLHLTCQIYPRRIK